jgi:hypothetical protein
MNKEQQIAEYLEKAKEAEDQGIRTKDPQEKENWLKIAASYRELAGQRPT